MTETASLQVKVDTTEVRRASDDLKELATDAAPRASQATEQYSKDAEKAERSASVFSRGLQGLKGQLVGLAAGLSAGAFAAWVKGAIDAADATAEAAEAAGLALDEYTKLQMAFQIGAAEGANLQLSMTQLNKAISESSPTLQALGIATTTASGELRSAYDVMLDLADQFQRMPDDANQTALAIDLFGQRAGPQLIPLLNQGRQGIIDLGAAAATVSEQLVQSSGEYEKNVASLTGILNSLRNEIAEGVLPRLNDMLAWAVQFGPTLEPVLKFLGFLSGIITGPLTFGLKSVMTALSLVMGAFTAFGQLIATVGAGLTRLAQGDFPGAVAAVKAGGQDLLATVKGTGDQLISLWGRDEDAAKTHTQMMAEAMKPVPMPTATATFDASSGKVTPSAGSVVIGATDIGTELAAQEQANQLRLAAEQSYLDLKAEMYAASDEGQEELRRLRDEAAEEEHQNNLSRIQAEVNARQEAMASTSRLLQQGAQKSKTIAKAAERFQGLMAASQIAKDTLVAASGARAALSMIPIVGPGLGQAAFMAIMASGTVLAGQALTGRLGGGAAPLPSVVPGINDTSASLSQNQVAESSAAQQSRVIRLTGGNRRYTTEEVAEIMEEMGERISDNGGRIGKVQVVTA
jgi:hypothetical protein